MLFNSIDFAIFLPIVFVFYWLINDENLKLQNFLIVISSYIFYGWWDWRFLSLIVFSTIIDFLIGVRLSQEKNTSKRKILLWISVLVNLGFLVYFKYYNFFLDNFTEAFSFFGHEIKANTLNIILPIGISFYTFQTLSYTIDTYRKKLEPTKDFIAFSAFVCFFPQLVAGPIERATNLLPQFHKKRKFNYSNATDGLRQVLWGLFKKIVIADNCAEYANLIFNNSELYSGSTLVLGALFFTFQIYCDFSGYSDIAIGTSRLFGFNLKKNFNYPYFSRDIAEFWRRWHISLSTWFRDYLYIPLGGSRGGLLSKIRNTFIIFLVSGFWHGASYTFIVWGALNAIYFLPLLLSNKNRNNLDVIAKGKIFPNIKDFLMMMLTFSLTVLAWIFFRAEDIGHAITYISQIFSDSILDVPNFVGRKKALTLSFIITGFIIIEWFGREEEFPLAAVGLLKKRSLRWIIYSSIIFIIGIFMQTNETNFIYFKF
jgi:D-alanyl-lipoteichoic acid acyltransferase DltB (MBOAT superfamily)